MKGHLEARMRVWMSGPFMRPSMAAAMGHSCCWLQDGSVRMSGTCKSPGTQPPTILINGGMSRGCKMSAPCQ